MRLLGLMVLMLVGLPRFLVMLGVAGCGSTWVGAVEKCRVFCSVPGPLHSVQRAEIWGVILVLQAAAAVQIGIGNLDVVRHVDRIIQGLAPCKPFELLNDGDPLYLVHIVLDKRRPGLTGKRR